jgi:hypothetical protein
VRSIGFWILRSGERRVLERWIRVIVTEPLFSSNVKSKKRLLHLLSCKQTSINGTTEIESEL